MYRDFDGKDGTFGNTSVLASTSDVTDSSIYASIDSSNNNQMTLVALNKSTQALPVTMQLEHVQPGATAAIYQLISGNTTPQYMGTVTITNPADFTYTMPGYSITTIRIIAPTGQGLAPTVATAAHASASPVTGVTTNLSVLGADAGGEANLTYTWTATSAPAPVSFSANATNAAKNTVATFGTAGTYTFLATITNAGGYFATSSVTVTVAATVTNIVVTPGTPTVPGSGTQQFTASSTDQFDQPLATPPAFAWTASVGTITSAGVFNAPAAAGSVTVSASAGGVHGSTTAAVTSPTTIVVSTASEAALRSALAGAETDAGAGTAVTIRFAGSLIGDTIKLTQPLQLQAATGVVSIDGGGLITLSGGGTTQLFAVASGAQLALEGLTIEAGSSGSSNGGALANAGTLTIDNCTLAGNTAGASSSGGAIDNTGVLTVTNTTISGNSGGSTGNGGGIENVGTLTVSDSTITGNTVGQAAAHYAGIAAAGVGGGIDNNGGTLLLNDVRLSGNTAGNEGGGLFSNGTLTVLNSSLLHNAATNGGGIVNDTGGLATVANSTIADNTAAYIAGGLNNLGTMTVANSTFTGNFAYLGGAIYNGNYYGVSGTLTLSNCTITANFAFYGGGAGIYMANGLYSPTVTSTLTLLSTLVAGNFSSGNANDFLSDNAFPYGNDVDVFSGTVNGSYNLIGDGQDLTGISNGDANHNHVGSATAPIKPLLAPLVASSDPMQTVTTNPATYDAASYDAAGIPLDDNGGPTKTIAVESGSPALAAAGPLTTLSATLGTGVTTMIPVTNAAALAVTPGQYFIMVDGEEMEVTNVNLTTNVLTVIRAVGGTPATLHPNDPVYLATDQRGTARTVSGAIGAYQVPAAAPPVTQVNGDLFLIGTSGNDHAVLNSLGAGNIVVTFNGVDQGTFNIASGHLIHVQLGSGNDTLSLNDPTLPVIDTGGTGSNTLDLSATTGPNLWALTGAGAGTVAALTFTGMANLTGGAGNDTFAVHNGDFITSINGGAGSNTLDYSGYTGGMGVSLQTDSAGYVSHFSNIQNLIGSPATNNTLVGANTANTWNLTGADAGTVDGVTFSAFQYLVGGNGSDSFAVHNGDFITSINGGAGSNTLDYSGYTGGMGVSLQTDSAGYVNHFGNIQNLIGSSATNNTLVGANSANTWNLTGAHAGTVNGVTFSAFQYLVGGSGSDSFVVHNGDYMTSIDGGAGSNTLDYSGYTGGMGVSLQTDSAGYVNHFGNIQNLIGSPATNNTLVGANTANTWNLTGANAGTVNGITFSAFQYLVGGSGSDTYHFAIGAALSGSLSDAGGSNWLDYSAWTSAVTVNLTAGSASGITGKVSGIQNVIGGAAADTITGGATGGILIGGAGNDTITAGAGRSILIGDAGNDHLNAGTNGDILIGGSTSYDSPTLNKAALVAVLAEWQRTDINYAARVTDLRNGTGLTQGNKLTWGTSVLDDSSSNTLTGNASAAGNEFDWFFANQAAGHDAIVNLLAGEQVN
jgi:hypothetical protein